MRQTHLFNIFLLATLAGCGYNEASDGAASDQEVCAVGGECCDDGAKCADPNGQALECACGQWVPESLVDDMTCDDQDSCRIGDECSYEGKSCTDENGEDLECACTLIWVPESLIGNFRCDGQGECDPGEYDACTTSCGSQGNRVCGSNGEWGNCFPPNEICGNGKDDDCDYQVDECGNGNPDSDSDGWVDSQDCQPYNPSVHPNATELCNDVDDDCDNQTDEGCPPDGGTETYAVRIMVDGTYVHHVWCEGGAIQASSSVDAPGNDIVWYEPWHSFGCDAYCPSEASPCPYEMTYDCTVHVPTYASLRFQCYLDLNGCETCGDNVRFVVNVPSQLWPGETLTVWENGVQLQFPGSCLNYAQGPASTDASECAQVARCQ